ncbi:MAG: hypothetical protein ACRDPO_22330 [Streptosporangiaceae bacterium]
MSVGVEPLEDKLDAAGYGIFIPIFVSSGMTLDVPAIIRSPGRVQVFLALCCSCAACPRC